MRGDLTNTHLSDCSFCFPFVLETYYATFCRWVGSHGRVRVQCEVDISYLYHMPIIASNLSLAFAAMSIAKWEITTIQEHFKDQRLSLSRRSRCDAIREF